MKRPLVYFSISLIAGILAAFYSNSYFFIISTIILQAALVLTISRNHGGLVLLLAGIMLFYTAGAFEFLAVKRLEEGRFREFAGEYVIVRGRIASEADAEEERVRYIVEVKEVIANGQARKTGGKILLTTLISNDSVLKEPSSKAGITENNGKAGLTENGSKAGLAGYGREAGFAAYGGEAGFNGYGSETGLYEYGSEIEFEGTLNIPQEKRNPGGFDYRLYLAQSRVSATMFARHENIKASGRESTSFLEKAGLAVRRNILGIIHKSLPEQQAGLLAGMLIGYREGMSKDVQEAFSNAGLSHLVAVSGANVAFVAAPFVFMFKKLRLKRTAANIIIICILLFFVFITGFEPSVVRAVIMAVVIFLGKIINRETDIYTSIAFAAILMLLYNPFTLFDIGFQLSFAATLSLVMLYKGIKEIVNIKFLPASVSDAVSVTLAAQVGVLPLAAVYFNKISVISVISNLIVMPVIEVITILGMLMAFLGQISIILSRLIGYVNCALLSFVLFTSKLTASFPYAVLRIFTPSILLIVTYYMTLWFFLYYRPKRGIRLKAWHLAVPLTLMVLLAFLSILPPGKLQVVFLDVGQGDSAFIRTYSGKTVLIDGGGTVLASGAETNMGDRTVIPFLLDHGVLRLDLVVATHGHDDHMQGLIPVLDSFRVGRLVIPAAGNDQGLEKLVEIAERRNIPVSRCARGDRIMLDDSTGFLVLHPESGPGAGNLFSSNSPLKNKGLSLNNSSPPDNDGSSLNNDSLVLKLYFKDMAVLFPGDIEAETESILVKDNGGLRADLLRADVLKVAHHGSVTSTTEEFLASVSPKAAVISVGRNNFGHPSAVVLEKLERAGINLFRTDTDGAVILESDGKRIAIRKTIPGRGDR